MQNPSPMPVNAAPQPWYTQPWFTVVMLIFLAPVGWILMWKYQKWGTGIKAAATVCSLILFVSALNDSNKPTTNASSGVSSGVSNTSATSATRSQTKTAPQTASSGASKPDRMAKAPRSSMAAAPAAGAQKASAQGSDDLPSNVQVQDLKGLGKREVGIVDQVAYGIKEIEKTPAIGNEFSKTQADRVFVVVRAFAFNQDKKTHNITTAGINLLDSQDREFDPSSNGQAALAMNGDQSVEILTAQVQPETLKHFTLVYDVPQNATGFKLKIPSGTFSLDKELIIRAPK